MANYYFLDNQISDPIFLSYLGDINRLQDYKKLRDHALPKLFSELDRQFQYKSYTFKCMNRFEGRHPALRINCPAGFMLSCIDIELEPASHAFCIKHASQSTQINGIDAVVDHLSSVLTIGWANAQVV